MKTGMFWALFTLAAPVVAFLGWRFGRYAKGGVALGAVLLGLGAVMDPPTRHASEATQPVKGREGNGEPE